LTGPPKILLSFFFPPFFLVVGSVILLRVFFFFFFFLKAHALMIINKNQTKSLNSSPIIWIQGQITGLFPGRDLIGPWSPISSS